MPTSFCFNVAKKLIFTNIKKALGLDQARYLIVGAAPLSSTIKDYFLSLNLTILNIYGMSECSGPQTGTFPQDFEAFDDIYLNSAGKAMVGTELEIFNKDQFSVGEICFRGRNRFMGYYKNEESTRNTIDSKGFIRSGDLGKLDDKDRLIITGF